MRGRARKLAALRASSRAARPPLSFQPSSSHSSALVDQLGIVVWLKDRLLLLRSAIWLLQRPFFALALSSTTWTASTTRYGRARGNVE